MWLSVMGDSISTYQGDMGVKPYDTWSALLCRLLAPTFQIRARCFAISNYTTTQMRADIVKATHKGTPDIAILFGGVNDPPASIAGATTQANLVWMGETLWTAGVRKLLLMNTVYKNFPPGGTGDTVDVPHATNATLRTFQLAAVGDLNTAHADPPYCVYGDVYNAMRQKIVDNVEVQEPNSWHAPNGGLHLNTLGHKYVAEYVKNLLISQNWLS